MHSIMKPTAAFLFQLSLAGCSYLDNDLLDKDLQDFSSSVTTLTAVIEKDFALTEEVNTIAFTDNLEFQFETGANPPTTVKPLFSGKAIAARQSVLAAMTGYVGTLNTIASGQSIQTSLPKLKKIANDLTFLDPAVFEITHSLSAVESTNLVQGMTFFQEFFILPARDRRLVPIMKKGEATLKKAATLLYLDIGTIQDQSGKCSYTVPDNNTDAPLSSLRMCRGGLRLFSRSAINSDIATWKGWLAYERRHGQKSLAARTDMVRNLVNSQRMGEKLDQLFSNTQAALVAMMAAHEEIMATLDATVHAKKPSSLFQSKNTLFLQQVKALSIMSASVEAAVKSMPPGIVSSKN